MTYEELIEHFVYEPDTGMLRKIKNCRKPYPWRKIGTDGRYLATTMNGKVQYLHRLVWFYHYKTLPAQIDHIDNNPKNNRIENLRPCTSAQNQFNSRRKCNNQSGFKGVVFHAHCVNRPWQAKLGLAGKTISFGYYSTPEEASAAYVRGVAKYAREFTRAGQ